MGYLVEEGVDWVEKLIKDLGDDIKTELDYLVILLHSFLVELSFSVEDGGIYPHPGWKSSSGVYILKYLLQPSTTTTCQLIVTKLGESVLKVHGIHLPDKTTFTLSSLKIPHHIKTVETKFQASNLQHLSRSFKNELGLPLLQTCRSHLGLPIKGLLGLPPEVLLGILRFLPITSIISTSSTCKQLNDASKDQSLWRRLLKKDFPGKEAIDWREAYKKEYVAKKEEEERKNEALRNRMLPPPMFPYPDPVNPDGGPALPMIPGMVGGDYDRFPMGGGMGPLGGGVGPFGGGPGPFGRGRGPRFDPPGPNYPNMGPSGFGRGNPMGFGGGGFGFM